MTTINPPHLLSLPPEIRNEIYSLCLTASIAIILDLSTYRISYQRQLQELFRRNRPLCLTTSLLRTNQQIHVEASSVLYGANPFILEDHSDHFSNSFATFFSTIGPRNRSYIRNLTLNWAARPKLLSRRGVRRHLMGMRNPHTWEHITEADLQIMALSLLAGQMKYITDSIGVVARDFSGIRELCVLFPRNGPDEPGETPNGHFASDVFTVQPEISEALEQVRGLRKLVVGNTMELGRMEKLARMMGIEEVEVRWSDFQLFELLQDVGEIYQIPAEIEDLTKKEMEIWMEYKDGWAEKGWAVGEWNDKMARKIFGGVELISRD